MKLTFKNTLVIPALLLVSMASKAQKMSSADSLMASMNAGDKSSAPVVIFKSTRLVLSQTTEMVKKGNLNFQIIHRFGDIAGANGGPQTAFGIDRVNDVMFGFEYGVSDNFNIDLDRSTIGQLVQIELKYAALHQTSNGSPIAITLLGETGARPYAAFPTFSSRLSYLAQAVFARKFSDEISFQVSPTFVRDNTAYPHISGNEEQFFAVQSAIRFALNRHMGFIVDYAHPFSTFRDNNYNFKDPLGIGYEVETGGHVFTLNVTNANSVSEINYLSNSQQRFSRGQYRIGFTISRMFDLRPKHKEPKN